MNPHRSHRVLHKPKIHTKSLTPTRYLPAMKGKEMRKRHITSKITPFPYAKYEKCASSLVVEMFGCASCIICKALWLCEGWLPGAFSIQPCNDNT